MKNTADAIRILQNAGREVAHSGEPGSIAKINSLHNAVEYLLRGSIFSSRGVAHLWAEWPIGA